MVIKIIMFLNLLTFGFVVSQSFMYMIALADVQKSMDAPSYIQLRKLLDKNFRAKFSLVVYAALATSLVLCLVTASHPRSILFVSSVIAFSGLVTDIILTLKGNVPINNIINSWGKDDYPPGWQSYRKKWLSVFRMRQIANITAFISLLSGALLGN